MPPKRKAAEVSGEKSKSLAPQPKKSKFAVSPKYFLNTATSLQALLSGDSELSKVECKPKKFSTSSIGWGGNTRVKIPVKIKDGESQELEAQVSINITLLGSKAAAAAEANDEKDGETAATAADKNAEATDDVASNVDQLEDSEEGKEDDKAE